MDVHHQYAQEGIYPIDVDELFGRSQPHPAHGLGLSCSAVDFGVGVVGEFERVFAAAGSVFGEFG